MWRKRENTAKGLAAGLIGGLFAAWVMNQFQAGMSKLKESRSPRESESEQSGRERSQSGQGQRSAEASGEERANVKAAVLVAENVLHSEVPPERKQPAGEAVHYAFGGAVGAVYGMAVEKSAIARAGLGSAFGGVLWLFADEIGVPAMRLSRPPQEYSAEVHASALAAHLVYGVTAELVRRGLRSGWLAD